MPLGSKYPKNHVLNCPYHNKYCEMHILNIHNYTISMKV